MTSERFLIRPMASGGHMVIDTASRMCVDEHGLPFECRRYVVAAGCTYQEAEDYIRRALAYAEAQPPTENPSRP